MREHRPVVPVARAGVGPVRVEESDTAAAFAVGAVYVPPCMMGRLVADDAMRRGDDQVEADWKRVLEGNIASEIAVEQLLAEGNSREAAGQD